MKRFLCLALLVVLASGQTAFAACQTFKQAEVDDLVQLTFARQSPDTSLQHGHLAKWDKELITFGLRGDLSDQDRKIIATDLLAGISDQLPGHSLKLIDQADAADVLVHLTASLPTGAPPVFDEVPGQDGLLVHYGYGGANRGPLTKVELWLPPQWSLSKLDLFDGLSLGVLAALGFVEAPRAVERYERQPSGLRLPFIKQQYLDMLGCDRFSSGMHLADFKQSLINGSPSDAQQAQTWLRELGYNSGQVDGIDGPMTQTALEAFFRDTYHPELKPWVTQEVMAVLEGAIEEAPEQRRRLGLHAESKDFGLPGEACVPQRYVDVDRFIRASFGAAPGRVSSLTDRFTAYAEAELIFHLEGNWTNQQKVMLETLILPDLNHFMIGKTIRLAVQQTSASQALTAPLPGATRQETADAVIQTVLNKLGFVRPALALHQDDLLGVLRVRPALMALYSCAAPLQGQDHKAVLAHLIKGNTISRFLAQQRLADLGLLEAAPSGEVHPEFMAALKAYAKLEPHQGPDTAVTLDLMRLMGY